MPFVEIHSPTQGKLRIRYEISTPTKTSTAHLDERLPVVLFLHPEYVGMEIFHPQFEDAQLRRFNLVALDFRGHGDSDGPVDMKYCQEDAAYDVVQFMDKIGIKSCLLVGVSLGTTIGLQVAVTHPERINGMFLVSPLGTEEIEDVRQGRNQVLDTWLQGFSPAGELVDQSAIDDAAMGAQQFACNNVVTPLFNSITLVTVKHGYSRVMRGQDLRQIVKANVVLATRRRSHSRESLSRIKCPIKLVHCTENVAYDLAYVKDFIRQLQDASVPVSLHIVKAAHFGTVEKPELINPLMTEFLLQNTRRDLPPPPIHVVSPFEASLVECGLREETSDWDSDYDED